MTLTVDYKNYVLGELKKMASGTKRKLNPGHPSYDLFVRAVKVIIEWGEDRLNGFFVDFNSDYTRVYKGDLSEPVKIKFLKPLPNRAENKVKAWRLIFNKKVIIASAPYPVCNARMSAMKNEKQYAGMHHLIKIVPAA